MGVRDLSRKKALYSSRAMPAVSGTDMVEGNGRWLTGQRISYGASPILKQILLTLFPAVYQESLNGMTVLITNMNSPTVKKSSPCECSKTEGLI